MDQLRQPRQSTLHGPLHHLHAGPGIDEVPIIFSDRHPHHCQRNDQSNNSAEKYDTTTIHAVYHRQISHCQHEEDLLESREEPRKAYQDFQSNGNPQETIARSIQKCGTHEQVEEDPFETEDRQENLSETGHHPDGALDGKTQNKRHEIQVPRLHNRNLRGLALNLLWILWCQPYQRESHTECQHQEP